VVLAEHRLERVIEYADMVVVVDAFGNMTSGSPTEMMRVSDVAPPVVRLGQAVGWDPLPLSVRDARRRSGDLRTRLDGRSEKPVVLDQSQVALHARRVVVRYGDLVAVAGVDVDVHAGEVLALMGRNGSGKTSLLWALQGSGPRHGGTVALGDDQADPARLAAGEATTRIGLVPQSPGDLLYLSTVAAECALADSESAQPAGACRELLDRIVPGIDDGAHPRDLSEGQRLALALAVQLCSRPAVLMLDEPTRGLDESAKTRFADVIKELAREGRAVVVATHDVEFVANVADRVVVLADGEVVADGTTADVVVASPIFAPQVAKVMRPERWLTVGQIIRAIGAEGVG